MTETLHELLDRFHQGLIDRRAVLKGMALAATGALAGKAGGAVAAAPAGMVPVSSINHLHIEVSDVKRSVEFYTALYGGKPAGGAPNMQTLVLPGARPDFGSWLSLSSGRVDKEHKYDKTDGRPGHISHLGLGTTMPITEFPKLAAEIKKRFPDVQAPNLPITEQAGQEIYIFDPDGIPTQLIPTAFNAWGEVSTAAPVSPPLAPAMSINHMHLEVSDLKRSVEFYSVVYGAKPAGNGPGIQSMILPSARPGFGSWLSLSQGRTDTKKEYDKTDGKPGHFSHASFGVGISNKEFPRIAAEVKRRFPNVDQPNLPVTPQAGQEIYIFDPDGLAIQLIAIDFNAW